MSGWARSPLYSTWNRLGISVPLEIPAAAEDEAQKEKNNQDDDDGRQAHVVPPLRIQGQDLDHTVNFWLIAL